MERSLTIRRASAWVPSEASAALAFGLEGREFLAAVAVAVRAG